VFIWIDAPLAEISRMTASWSSLFWPVPVLPWIARRADNAAYHFDPNDFPSPSYSPLILIFWLIVGKFYHPGRSINPY
jgi:hypothetical protein